MLCIVQHVSCVSDLAERKFYPVDPEIITSEADKQNQQKNIEAREHHFIA